MLLKYNTKYYMQYYKSLFKLFCRILLLLSLPPCSFEPNRPVNDDGCLWMMIGYMIVVSQQQNLRAHIERNFTLVRTLTEESLINYVYNYNDYMFDKYKYSISIRRGSYYVLLQFGGCGRDTVVRAANYQ